MVDAIVEAMVRTKQTQTQTVAQAPIKPNDASNEVLGSCSSVDGEDRLHRIKTGTLDI